MENRQYILVVEPISTGALYVRDIAERGYIPIAYYVNTGMSEGFREVYKKKYIEPSIKTFPEETVVLFGEEDYESNLEKLRKYEIVCVVSGAERGTLMSTLLARDLGLKGNPVTIGYACREKDKMQSMAAAAGLRSIKGRAVKSVEEAGLFIEQENLNEIVIKPVDGAGSVGVHLCSGREEALQVLEKSFGKEYYIADKNKGMMVQERITGTEYIVNTMSCNGHHVVTDIWRYNKIPLGVDGIIYDRIFLITRLEPVHLALAEYALKVVEALGIQYGPTHGEYMVDEKGPVLMEIGARPMGGAMPKSFLDAALKHHITDLSLDACLAPERYFDYCSKGYRPVASALFISVISGADRNCAELPLFPIFKNLKSLHKLMFTTLLDSMHVDRTIDLKTSPGSVLLLDRDEGRMMREYELIRRLETEYPALLFGVDEKMAAALDGSTWDAKDILPQINEDCIVLSNDPGSCSCRPVIDLNRPESFEAAGIETVLLHLSGPLGSLEDVISSFAEAVKKPGFKRILIPEISSRHFPYGREGLAQLLLLNGFVLDMPRKDMSGWLTAVCDTPDVS